MAIRTIETVVDIEEDRRLIVQLPPDVPLGRHRVVAVLDESAEGPARISRANRGSFRVLAEARWPDDIPLTREAMYDDNGR